MVRYEQAAVQLSGLFTKAVINIVSTLRSMTVSLLLEFQVNVAGKN
jgi:hypothetical protein